MLGGRSQERGSRGHLSEFLLEAGRQAGSAPATTLQCHAAGACQHASNSRFQHGPAAAASWGFIYASELSGLARP